MTTGNVDFDAVDTNFRHLRDSDLIVTLGGIVDKLAAHPALQTPWPDVVPNPEQLKEQIATFRLAINAAANGDRQKIQERSQARAQLERSGVFTAQYLVMKAVKDQDPSIVLNSGFPLKQSMRSYSIKRPTPGNLILKHGTVSGTVIARTGKIPNAGTYELQYSQADPPTEESWITVGMFVRCNRMEVTGLEPAKKTTFRVRPHDSHGPGPWSPTVSLIVL